MIRVRCLDLFCGGGGASAGYMLAGYEVTGVDKVYQKGYPGNFFVLGDAFEYLVEHGAEYDLIHASPPCQAYSQLRYSTGREYPDLVAVVRQFLQGVGVPYVIENVPGAPLASSAVMLCGTFFGLKVYRHRRFETWPFPLLSYPHVAHKDSTPSSGRGISPKGFVSVTGNGGASSWWYGGKTYTKYCRDAMGIYWSMSRSQLSQAIPPAYTEWVGNQVRRLL